MANKGSWFRIDAAAATPTVYIYDEIGIFGVNANDFAKELKALGNLKGKDLKVRINSPGGDVFTGWTLMALLRDTGAKITVYVDGVAASMASAIVMMGDHVIMAEGAQLMIHNPMGRFSGGSEEMRSAATLLDSIKEGMITAYSKKSGLDREAIAKIMDDETWLTAIEAVEHGFADEVGEVVKAVAHFDLARYSRNPPKDSPEASTKEDQMALSKEDLEALGAAIGGAVANANKPVLDAISALKTEAKPEAKAKDEAPVKTEAELRKEITDGINARSGEITELCALAGLPALTAEYVAGTKTVAEVRADLKTKKAEAANNRQRTGINNHTGGSPEAKTGDDEDLSDLIPGKTDVWAKFNSVGRNGRPLPKH